MRSGLMTALRRSPRRVTGAAACLVGAVVLLTGGPGTEARFWRHAVVNAGTIETGSVSLSGSLSIELLSRQPSGSRTWSSPTTCSAGAPYVECRVVTSSLDQERLVPGDLLRITRTLTLAGSGDNLAGTLTVDASGVLNRSSSALAQAATVTGSVTGPAGVTTPLTGLTASLPVSRRAMPTGFGAYSVVVMVDTPAATTDGSGRWDTRLRGDTLDLGTVTATFQQGAA